MDGLWEVTELLREELLVDAGTDLNESDEWLLMKNESLVKLKSSRPRKRREGPMAARSAWGARRHERDLRAALSRPGRICL